MGSDVLLIRPFRADSRRCGLAVLSAATLMALACDPTVSREADPADAEVRSGPGIAMEAGAGHAELSCSECHRGETADRARGSVPGETCVSGDCHRRSPRSSLTMVTVEFHHVTHGDSAQVAVECAGCHRHEEGGGLLTAGAETCGLCHESELAGVRGEECRVCHQDLEFEGATSQGVAVPHQGLPWVSGGCVRCHFDVSRPSREVSAERCDRCHANAGAVTAAGLGEDLHPDHTGVSCGTCHEADTHRIQAMSSAVDLRCTDCHDHAHDVELGYGLRDPATCIACHRDTHAEPQRLFLGLVDGMPLSAPSHKFTQGLTCRSCHVPAERPGRGGVATRGSGSACTGCHGREYDTVLRWWEEGIAERISLVEAYLGAADVRLPASALEGVVVDVRRRLGLLDRGGAYHNLILTHQMLDQSIEEVAAAYSAAGVPVPPRPDFGLPPRPGFCSYCHYRLEARFMSEEMDDAFHRSVVGR
ncbi:MAG: hypothetical protein OEZ65_00115 [Gemmatimonadota bacterium]|nr:hypothetical protein [Gemmatimonadota bacterium]MDH5757956.1 hypothetical protein [Gemmatimonadota bacterium]